MGDEEKMKRPYVILNSAMTLDGKISTREGDSQISCEEDLDRAHKLRSDVDAVMVGIGTVLADNPALTVRRVEGENPIRVIVDSEARTPSEARVLNSSAPTIVAVAEKAEESERERLRSQDVQVIVAGEEKVDLSSLLENLSDQNLNKILLEGGSTLNWSMLSEGLVDEVRIAVNPCIVGGEDAKTLAGGLGVGKTSDGIKLKLVKSEEVGKNLLLVYEVEDTSCD